MRGRTAEGAIFASRFWLLGFVEEAVAHDIAGDGLEILRDAMDAFSEILVLKQRAQPFSESFSSHFFMISLARSK